jgi:outer membrane murein-binding lipoprotein Lpp
MSSPVAQVRARVPRIAGVAVERARLTVVPRRRTKAARMPFVALVSMVLLGGVVGLLLFNTSMQQASFAATALESQAGTLAARQQSLEMDLDRLRDPQRIAKAAQGLGMVQACSPAFLELDSGKVVGQPCAATGQTPFRIEPKAPAKPAALDPRPKIVWVDPPADTRGDTRADTLSGSGAGGDAAGRNGGEPDRGTR